MAACGGEAHIDFEAVINEPLEGGQCANLAESDC